MFQSVTCRDLHRFISDIKHSSLSIKKTSIHKPKPNLSEPLLFGSATTDHLLEIDWNSMTGWGSPSIHPYAPLQMDPCTSVLHYGTGCFEGMKAYSTTSGNLMLFRPEMNMERMRRSANSVGLPDFDGKELLKCIKEQVKIDSDWVPNKKAYSLYIRPTLLGTHIQLGVVQPKAAKMIVIASAVGPYYPDGFVPVNLYCDDTIVRAWPGGSGDKKIIGNYGPPIGHTIRINELGYHSYLWLTEGFITEMGTMNFFCYWVNKEGKKELVTSPLDSTILPGVTRDSILKLSREWNEFQVTERKMRIEELITALEENRIIEIFGSGTACIVCPVGKIFYKEKDYNVPLELGKSGELTQKLSDYLLSVQHGEIKHPWAHLIT